MNYLLMLKSEIIFNNPFTKNWLVTWSSIYMFMYTFTESHEVLPVFILSNKSLNPDKWVGTDLWYSPDYRFLCS